MGFYGNRNSYSIPHYVYPNKLGTILHHGRGIRPVSNLDQWYGILYNLSKNLRLCVKDLLLNYNWADDNLHIRSIVRQKLPMYGIYCNRLFRAHQIKGRNYGSLHHLSTQKH